MTRWMKVFLTTFAILAVLTLIVQILSISIGGRDFWQYWYHPAWVKIVIGWFLASAVITIGVEIIMEANDLGLMTPVPVTTPTTINRVNLRKLITGLAFLMLGTLVFVIMEMPHEIIAGMESMGSARTRAYLEGPLPAIETPSADLPMAEFQLLKIGDLDVPSSPIGAAPNGYIVINVAVSKDTAKSGIPIPKDRGFKESRVWFRNSQFESKAAKF